MRRDMGIAKPRISHEEAELRKGKRAEARKKNAALNKLSRKIGRQLKAAELAAECDEELFSRDPLGNGALTRNRCRGVSDGTYLMKAEARGSMGKGVDVKVDTPPGGEDLWYVRRVKGRPCVTNGLGERLHNLVWREHVRASPAYREATEKARARMLRSRARFLNGDPLDCRLANLGPASRRLTRDEELSGAVPRVEDAHAHPSARALHLI